MEKLLLAVIGLAAAGYIARLIWRESKGESQCACSGCCGSCSKQHEHQPK